jgi:hypothetical protein
MGNVKARLIRYAKMIRTQDQLDIILSQAQNPVIARAWLEQYAQYLPFTPLQLISEPGMTEKPFDDSEERHRKVLQEELERVSS